MYIVCLIYSQIACPDLIETVKDADILVFVLPHQVMYGVYISCSVHALHCVCVHYDILTVVLLS